MMKPRHNIAYIAVITLIAAYTQSAQADIRDFFQSGEDVVIGDSIKGKMITFNTEGELHTLISDTKTLPSECRVVLEDDDTVWFENLFPMHTASHYRKWLKGSYIKDAEFFNPQTKENVKEDIFRIVPNEYTPLDHMKWVEVDKQYECSLNLRNAEPGTLPDIYYSDLEYETEMSASIKFIISDDMSLNAVMALGEIRAPFTTTYNYGVTNPYGIDLDNLTYKETRVSYGAEAYIANLKLVPKRK